MKTIPTIARAALHRLALLLVLALLFIVGLGITGHFCVAFAAVGAGTALYLLGRGRTTPHQERQLHVRHPQKN